MSTHFENSDYHATCGATKAPAGYKAGSRVLTTSHIQQCDCRRCLAILSKTPPKDAKLYGIKTLRDLATINV